METPQIDWPAVTIGGQRLTVRWTFYAQWLLSKRKVNVRELGPMLAAKDPALPEVLVECFAAAVAENFTSQKLPSPDAEYWAQAISADYAKDRNIWTEINAAIWAAVGKAQPAAAPPQETAIQATALN